MKQKVLLMLLALGMYSINASPQTKSPVRKTTTQTVSKAKPTPKDSREYQVEKDGFEWYKVCKQGKYGAESRDGKLLIPCEYDYIDYWDIYDIPGFFKVDTDKQGMGEGIYSRRGECIISISRNYHSITMNPVNSKEVGAYFQYNVNSHKGNTGICNIKGEKVFEAKCHYDDIQPHYKNGKFYFKVGICEDKKWRHGIIDGVGDIILPLKYKELYVFSWSEKIYCYNDGNREEVGSLDQIYTYENLLADNIKLTESYISNYSSTSSSSYSSSSPVNSNSGNSGNSSSTIVVEHHRDPVPVQEWVQCTACWGSGTCPDCAGSGTKYIGSNLHRCWRCGGRGRCSSCSGQGGKYYTVYK